MPMDYYATSGYVVKINLLRPLLPQEHHELFDRLVSEYATTELHELFDQSWPKNFPPVASFYSSMYEDSVHDTPMEEDKDSVYAVFDEEDLFSLIPTRKHHYLKDAGIIPVKAQWAIWGCSS